MTHLYAHFYAHFPNSSVYHTLRADDPERTACGQPVGYWWRADLPVGYRPCMGCRLYKLPVVRPFPASEEQAL